MTITQRLTRAGWTILILGAVSAFIPTNVDAFSATDGCTVASESYSVGTTPHDDTTTFHIAATNGASADLNSYLGSSPATATGVIENSNPAFSTFISSGHVKTTHNAVGQDEDSVSISFPGGRTVQYTVSSFPAP